MSTMHRHHLILTYSDYNSLASSRVISYPLHSIFYSRSSIFNPVVKRNELVYPFNKEYAIYGGSCNGILCLATKRNSSATIKNVLFWNPSIKKFKLLPSFKYDNYGYNPIFGFGYDHVHNVYKVVAIFYSVDGFFQDYGMVDTLGTNSWRLIKGEFPHPNEHYKSLKFVSGAINWIPYKKDYTHSVVSFDLVTESYKTLLQPNYGVEDMDKVILCVSRDCLCIFSMYTNVF
jgi:F-box interacting protein